MVAHSTTGLRQVLPGGDHRRRLAVRAEEVRDAGPDPESWLRRAGLLHRLAAPVTFRPRLYMRTILISKALQTLFDMIAIDNHLHLG